MQQALRVEELKHLSCVLQTGREAWVIGRKRRERLKTDQGKVARYVGDIIVS